MPSGGCATVGRRRAMEATCSVLVDTPPNHAVCLRCLGLKVATTASRAEVVEEMLSHKLLQWSCVPRTCVVPLRLSALWRRQADVWTH